MDRPAWTGFRLGLGLTLGVIAAAVLCLFVASYAVGYDTDRRERQTFQRIEAELALGQ